MVVNQRECSRLQQMSVIKFLVLISANHVKFTEKCVMCMKKHVLIKKKEKKQQKKQHYKWAKHGFATMSLSQKDNT